MELEKKQKENNIETKLKVKEEEKIKEKYLKPFNTPFALLLKKF